MLVKQSEIQKRFPLHRNAVKSYTVAISLIVFLIAQIFVFMLLAPIIGTLEPSPLTAVGLGIVVELVFLSGVVLLSYWYSVAFYKNYFYDLTDTDVVINSGVFVRREVTVPYKRIQDIALTQGPVDRRWNLWNLSFTTAGAHIGTGGKMVAPQIPGLSQESAISLKKMMLEKVRAEKE